jgi:hypothetical protein
MYWNTNNIKPKRSDCGLKKNLKPLKNIMSEFSQELGIPAKKKTAGLGRKMLWAAGSAAGFFLIRQIYNRMK